jgi:hypothetical protein
MKVRVLMTVLAASTALAVAACGGSSPAASPPASAPSGSGGSAAAANSSTQQASSPAKAIDVCAALPAAEASKITGTTFTSVKPNSVAGQIFGCDYSGPKSALLQISVDTGVGKLDLQSDLSALKGVGEPPKMVSGVGDEAFSAADPKGSIAAAGASSFASYGALFGNTYIKIGGFTYVTAAQGKQIVELLNSKL